MWLRLCKQDARPDEIAKAIRKLHGLVRAGKLRPLASSKPYTFSVAELQRYVDADTVAFGITADKETKVNCV